MAKCGICAGTHCEVFLALGEEFAYSYMDFTVDYKTLSGHLDVFYNGILVRKYADHNKNCTIDVYFDGREQPPLPNNTLAALRALDAKLLEKHNINVININGDSIYDYYANIMAEEITAQIDKEIIKELLDIANKPRGKK